MALSAGAALLTFIAIGFAVPRLRDDPSAPFVVHEWGTFLSVQGSDGVSVGGMVESEEELPVFVEWIDDPEGRLRAMLRQKMETPVTYFYTDVPRNVRVRVDMPRGILTHWYPKVARSGSLPPVLPRDGFLDWGEVELIPESGEADDGKGDALPEVGEEDTWRFARETRSARVRVRSQDGGGEETLEEEKFLFYRGLGTFELPLAVRSRKASDGLLRLANRGDRPLGGIVIVEVKGPTIRFGSPGDLAPGAETAVALDATLGERRPLERGVPEVKARLVRVLSAAGLYPEEARAMVNTWEESYFRSDGLRVLYILPREVVDEVIPLRLDPAPDAIERVMVGRVEILTKDREGELREWLARIGTDRLLPYQAREEAARRFGRLAEPFLRRLAEITEDDETQAFVRRMVEG